MLELPVEELDRGMMGLYLSPVWHTLIPEYRDEFGYMQNLYNGGVSKAIKAHKPWMLDNGVYTGRFTPESWVVELERWADYKDTCIGIVIPDVVGNAIKTLERWVEFSNVPKEYGYPVCLATQDGMKTQDIPWSELDVLFIGGTDEHKLGGEGEALCRDALDRGVWLHIGRVNSAKRILRFSHADSYDGTTLSIEPSIRNQQRILRAARMAQQMKRQRRLL